MYGLHRGYQNVVIECYNIYKLSKMKPYFILPVCKKIKQNDVKFSSIEGIKIFGRSIQTVI
jgi:hypothetical protein